MMVSYFIHFPTDWGIRPKFFKSQSEIDKEVRDYIDRLEIDPGALDKVREKETDRLYEKMQDTADENGEKPISKDDFCYKYQQDIEESAKKKFFEKLFNDHYRRIEHLIEKIDIANSDEKDLSRLKELADQYMAPDTAPDLEFGKALEARKANLKWSSKAAQFYKTAHVTNTVSRGFPGTKKRLKKYPKLVRLRYYKNEEGAIRQTVEIEIGP